jgi:methyl-accepting chemotaxis protein
MFQGINRALANTSVKLKLSMGFGLVLLLTLAITLTGWHGLDTMIERSESLTAIAQLNAMTKDLRAERIVFRVENTPESADRVVTRINEIEAHLVVLRDDSPPADILKLLNSQSDTVRALETTFAELGKLLTSREASRLRLETLSDDAIKSIGQVEAEVLKAVSQEQDSSERLGEFTNIQQLREQVQNARYAVQAYVFSRMDSYEVAAVTAIDEALKEVEQIARDQSDSNIAELLTARKALQGYRDYLGQFKELQTKTEATQESMEALSDSLLTSTGEITTLQSLRRDTEADQSRKTLIGVASMAMVLGLLAAWLITQQVWRKSPARRSNCPPSPSKPASG